MDSLPKIIIQNPFRILGVYANSPRVEIVANKSKSLAFLRVGRPVAFPLDLNGLLPPLERTVEMMNEAESHLAIAKEQLRYVQLWFLKMTNVDDIAFNHLLAGNIDEAISIWQKQDSLSSMQNRMVCFFIKQKCQKAITTAEQLYVKFGNQYINKVDTSSTLKLSKTELIQQFIDTIGNEVGMVELMKMVMSSEWKDYISSQTITPLINKISIEVERAKKVDHKDSIARKKAGETLIANTKALLNQLNDIMKDTDVQYQMIADKLGVEILQCGIDYFIGMKDKDYDAPFTAMEMLKNARTIVVGRLAVDRCDDQINELQKYIDNLPPKVIMKEYNQLMSAIADYVKYPNGRKTFGDSPFIERVDLFDFDSFDDKTEGALDFFERIRPIIIKMKEKVPKSEPHYVEVCTLAAHVVLDKSIETINGAQEKLNRLNPFLPSGINRSSLLVQLKNIVQRSWEAIAWMELMDVSDEFRKSRLNPNKNALRSISNSLDIKLSTNPVDKKLFYTDEDYYTQCSSLSEYQSYLERYQYGKHRKDAFQKIYEIRLSKCTTIALCDELLKDYPTKRSEIETHKENIFFKACTSVVACQDYIKKYPKGKYVAEVLKKMDELLLSLLEECETPDDCDNYIQWYPNSRYLHNAEERKDYLTKRQRRRKITQAILIIAAILLGVAGFVYWQLKSRQEEFAKLKELQRQRQELYDKITIGKDSSLCQLFLEKYPDSPQAIEVGAIEKEYYYNHLTRLDEFVLFLENNPTTTHRDDIIKRIVTYAEHDAARLPQEVDITTDLHPFEMFYYKYREMKYEGVNELRKDVESKINKIYELRDQREEQLRQDSINKEEAKKAKEEYEKYGTDANAWRTALGLNSISGFNDYLKRYPKGKHADLANKKIIDLEVQAVEKSGNYGYLPSVQKLSYTTGKYSTINLTNHSSSTITIMYSGVKSMKVILSPYGSRSITLPSSTYKVVATAPGVISFYGTENLTGGDYESQYSIVRR